MFSRRENSEMTKTFAIGAVVLAAIATCVPATAATLDNRDVQSYELNIVENTEQSSILVEDSAMLEGICATTCTVKLGENSQDINVAATDRLVIEDGQLYLEVTPVAVDDLED
jgi:hypothetical protein